MSNDVANLNPPPESLPGRPEPPGLARTPQLPETIRLATEPPSTNESKAGAPSPPAPNFRFGNYELLGEVARGGMGVVYRARDLTLGRVVALKMLRFGNLAGPEEVLRLHREAQIVAQLSHPNIIPIFEVGEHEGQHYFAMALAAGGSLAQHLDKYFNDDRLAVQLVEKVARAVDYANHKGILHRDLKPSNILLDERSEPLVSDFGIAKLLDSEVQHTQSGDVIGTPAYMAPEQAAGRVREIGPATDVWALGVMLYELLLSQRPFRAQSKEELRKVIEESHPAPPRLVQRGFDRDLETILLKCLEKNPANRYPTALQVADDLGRWLRDEPILARRRSWPVRAWRVARRHPWISVATAALLSAILLAPLVIRGLDPYADLNPALQELTAGRPALLVGASGAPAWSRWCLGGETALLNTTQDQTLQLNAWNSAFLELLPDPTSEHFRLEAEVQHTDSSLGEVGVFVAFEQAESETARNYYLCQFAFSDLDLNPPAAGEEPGSSLIHLKLRRLCQTAPGKTIHSHLRGTDVRRLFKAAAATRSTSGIHRTWRKLALEVRPEGIQAFWEDQMVGTLTWNEAQQLADKLARIPPSETDQAPLLKPRAPLGLLIENGTALFRNVVVRPLNP